MCFNCGCKFLATQVYKPLNNLDGADVLIDLLSLFIKENNVTIHIITLKNTGIAQTKM